MSHPAHMVRRAGYPPTVAGPAPPPGPGLDTRAAISPRTDMMGKMNNIADFVLGSAVSPKQLGIENGMRGMSIGVMSIEGDVNQNKPETNGTSLDNTKVEENGNISPGAAAVDTDRNIRQPGSSSRQGSPSQDEKNGNVPEDNGQYNLSLIRISVSDVITCQQEPHQCPPRLWTPAS